MGFASGFDSGQKMVKSMKEKREEANTTDAPVDAPSLVKLNQNDDEAYLAAWKIENEEG
jgi:hypothetical protein